MSLARRAQSYGKVISSQALTVDATTPQALTVPAGTVSALITAGANPVRWRADGTNPSATVGHYVAANGNIEIFQGDLASVRFVATTATSALFITYFGEA